MGRGEDVVVSLPAGDLPATVWGCERTVPIRDAGHYVREHSPLSSEAC